MKQSSAGYINRYSPGETIDQRAEINYAELKLNDIQLIVMDQGMGGEEAFNEAFSFMIICDDQESIDYYFEKLSYVPDVEQCG